MSACSPFSFRGQGSDDTSGIFCILGLEVDADFLFHIDESKARRVHAKPYDQVSSSNSKKTLRRNTDLPMPYDSHVGSDQPASARAASTLAA